MDLMHCVGLCSLQTSSHNGQQVCVELTHMIHHLEWFILADATS
jgi:hypothetical protein